VKKDKFGNIIKNRAKHLARAAARKAEGKEESVNEEANFQVNIEGLPMMFMTAMGKFGIEEVAPQDEPFNPEFHEAMSVQETEKVPSGTVLSVVQKGYLLNGRLVRPAMVIVAK